MPAPPILYITFSGPLVYLNHLPSTQLFPSPSDISVYKLVYLPFSFNYFGELFDHIFVISKCAITINPIPFCYYGSHCFQSFTSYKYFSLTNIPNGLMAAYYTNFQSGNITLSLTSEYAIISYWNMTSLNSTTLNSFQIILYSSGKVVLNYNQVSYQYKASNGLNTPLSGIVRQPIGYNMKLSPSQLASSQQYLGLYSLYPNLMTGVFAPFSSIASETSFSICPISSLWILEPSSFLVNSTMNSSLTVLSHGCVDDIDIHLVSADQRNYSQCILDNYNSSNAFVKYICDISLFIVAYGDTYVSIGWTSRESPSKPQVLDISPFKLYFQQPNSSSPIISGPNSCGFSGNAYQCGCDISAANISCLGAPCLSILGSSSVDYLYAVRDNAACGVTCSSDLFTDSHGNCCGLGALDCSGVCYGSSRFALSSEGELTCCQGNHFI